jgi:hypothetical protein
LLDEQRIQIALFRALVKGNFAVVPNVSWSWFDWETDLVAITRARYVHEYEIKISHSDFKADFKKRKHYRFKDIRREGKHARTPNYFWYVAPIKAIPICIPEYAGLIEVQGDRYGIDLVIVKRPRLLHRTKLSEHGVKQVLRSLMYKYWNIANDRDIWKIQRELFKKEWGETYD